MTNGLGIIGTGRMASALATLLSERGIVVSAIAGRSTEAAAVLARRCGAVLPIPIAEIAQHANTILIAVSDDAIEDVVADLVNARLHPAIALHTSGSAGPEALAALRGFGTAVGVMHPLQTIPSATAGVRALPGSAFAVAGDTAARNAGAELVKVLSGKLLEINSERWQHYHAAAVMASNYQVALIDAALELMEGAGVPRATALDALAPLITQSTANIVSLGCEAALTGPIRRGDIGTVLRHVAALRTSPLSIRRLYAAAGLQTVGVASRAGLPAEAAEDLAKALACASVQ